MKWYPNSKDNVLKTQAHGRVYVVLVFFLIPGECLLPEILGRVTADKNNVVVTCVLQFSIFRNTVYAALFPCVNFNNFNNKLSQIPVIYINVI